MAISLTHAAQHAHAKALSINLSNSHYGTFAEIGAGQEVARWFLRVGAASGTVAQTLSAYDKTCSDDLYGASTRYVSRERLLAMLDHEYSALERRLATTRGATTRFFVFADTIAERNYHGDNLQHGWIGVRFQTEPRSMPSDIVLHIHLNDSTAVAQQEAVGLLGVNLIYAAFEQRATADGFLGGLFDHLSPGRVEADVIELSGPAFEGTDARAWNLAGLDRGMTPAIMLGDRGQVVEPSEILHKRPVILRSGGVLTDLSPFRGTLQAAKAQLESEGLKMSKPPIALVEVARRPSDTGDKNKIEAPQPPLGPNANGYVVVANFPKAYMLIEYLRRYTAEPIRLIAGVDVIATLLHHGAYAELPGTLLEGLGKLLATNVKIYVPPMPREALLISDPAVERWVESTTAPIGIDHLNAPAPTGHLLRYMLDAGWVVPIRS